MGWQALFDRAAEYDVTIEEIQWTLEAQREPGDD